MDLYLYLIARTGYDACDTFDSAVVIAADSAAAARMHPADGSDITDPSAQAQYSWVNDPAGVTVTFLGNCNTQTTTLGSSVVCSSFNAG